MVINVALMAVIEHISKEPII